MSYQRSPSSPGCPQCSDAFIESELVTASTVSPEGDLTPSPVRVRPPVGAASVPPGPDLVERKLRARLASARAEALRAQEALDEHLARRVLEGQTSLNV